MLFEEAVSVEMEQMALAEIPEATEDADTAASASSVLSLKSWILDAPGAAGSKTYIAGLISRMSKTEGAFPPSERRHHVFG